MLNFFVTHDVPLFCTFWHGIEHRWYHRHFHHSINRFMWFDKRPSNERTHLHSINAKLFVFGTFEIRTTSHHNVLFQFRSIVKLCLCPFTSHTNQNGDLREAIQNHCFTLKSSSSPNSIQSFWHFYFFSHPISTPDFSIYVLYIQHITDRR